MAKKAIITTDFPTPGEVAARLNISPARVAELERHIAIINSTRTSTTAKRRRAATSRRSSKKK